MALDVVLSPQAAVAVALATQGPLDVELLPDHRLGQHVDFDDSNIVTGNVVTRQADGTFAMEGVPGGISTFLGLSDTPGSYAGATLQVVRVNAGETALEFVTLAGGGDMTVAVYDPAAITEQLVGLVATQTLTNKTIVDLSNTVAANAVHVQFRNESGSAMARGDAVVVSGFNGGLNLPLVSLADASGASTMPMVAILLDATLANNANGEFVLLGAVAGFNTNSFSVGDPLFVSETGTSGNTLQNTPPTGPALVQAVGEVLRSHPSLGVISVVGAGRANALPNLPSANVWVGDGSAVPTPTGTTGTGLVVRQGSPTLTTPTIASFVNAGHDHSAGAGGGALAVNSISNTILADMPAWTLKLRNAGSTGDPGDVLVSALTDEPTPASGDFFLIELASGELRRADIGNLPSAGANTLDQAYDEGGPGVGRIIEATDGAVFVRDTTTLSPAEILQVRSAQSGALTAQTADVNAITSVRTLTSGSITDDFNSLRVQRSNVVNGGGTFTTDGSVVRISNDVTETSGSIVDGVILVELDASAAEDPVLDVRVMAEANPRWTLDSDGDQQWGPGSAGALDTSLTRTAAGVLDLVSILDVNTGLRVAGAAAANTILRGDGTNYVVHTPMLRSGATIFDPATADATDDATLFFTTVAITVTAVISHITGTTNVVFNIQHASTRNGTGLDVFTSDITLTSVSGQTNNSGFNDATIPANSWVWVEITSVSGTPTRFHATVEYTED